MRLTVGLRGGRPTTGLLGDDVWWWALNLLHGPGGTGEPVAALLIAGNAGSNTASDHITATQLATLPKEYRRGRRNLIRTDSAGGTHDFVAWLARRGRWLG